MGNLDFVNSLQTDYASLMEAGSIHHTLSIFAGAVAFLATSACGGDPVPCTLTLAGPINATTECFAQSYGNAFGVHITADVAGLDEHFPPTLSITVEDSLAPGFIDRTKIHSFNCSASKMTGGGFFGGQDPNTGEDIGAATAQLTEVIPPTSPGEFGTVHGTIDCTAPQYNELGAIVDPPLTMHAEF